MSNVIDQVFKILVSEKNLWKYAYEVKWLDRNDLRWQRLFASLNNNTFNIENLWSLFSEQGNKDVVKKDKFLREKVPLDAPRFNE